MLPISVCMIAKNESKNIKTCLEALKPFNFEIVVVDTGSTDNTIALARRYTNRVYSFEWCDDFSAARNYSIEKASNDWILILDCDEVVEKFDIDAVIKMMTEEEASLGQIMCMNEMTDPYGNVTYINAPLERFFNRSYYHYTSSIHEQVTAISSNRTTTYTQIPIIIVHTGYNITGEEKIKKQTRNITLLEKAILDEPLNAYLHFQIGQSAYVLGDIPRSIKAFETALSLAPSRDADYTRLIYTHYATILKEQNRNQQAINLLDAAGDLLTDYSDAAYLYGTIYYDMGHYPAAILRLIEALNCNFYYEMSTKTYLPQYMLGYIYEQLGNKELACSFYNNCLNYRDAAARKEALSS